MSNEPHSHDEIKALQDRLESKFHQLSKSDCEREQLALQLQMIAIREQLDMMTTRHYRFTSDAGNGDA